jgi:hypothetical protein
LTQTIGGLQLNALSQLLPTIASLSGKGISQRETVGQQNPFVTGIGIAAPVAGAILGGPAGAAIGSQLGGLFGGGGGGGGGASSFASQFAPADFSHLFQPSPISLTGSPTFASGGNGGFGFVPSFAF